MYRIVTTYKDDSVQFVVHDVSAFNDEHCEIIAVSMVRRYFSGLPLTFHKHGQGRFTICSQGWLIGGIGFGVVNDIDSGGTQAVRILEWI